MDFDICAAADSRKRNDPQSRVAILNVFLDTAENEPSGVWYKGLTFCKYIAWIRYLQPRNSETRNATIWVTVNPDLLDAPVVLF